jgi:hypothetical protein
MTDSNLRELERRFRTSGSVEDEAAWLLARVRAGELEQSKLNAAAFLEHKAARLAGYSELPLWNNDIRAFVSEIIALGAWRTPKGAPSAANQLAIRCLCASAYSLAENKTDDRLATSSRLALAAVDRWIPHPTKENQTACVPFLIPTTAFDDVYWLCYLVTRKRLAKPTLSTYLERGLNWASPGGLMRAAQQEVVPWLLGYRDPVADRCADRVSRGEPIPPPLKAVSACTKTRCKGEVFRVNTEVFQVLPGRLVCATCETATVEQP